MSRFGTHSNQKAMHACLNTCHSLQKKKVWDFRDFRGEILLILKDEVMTRQRECLVKDVSEGRKIAWVRGEKMQGVLVMWGGGQEARERRDGINTSPVKMVTELLQHVSMMENESVIYFFFQFQLSTLPSFFPKTAERTGDES